MKVLIFSLFFFFKISLCIIEDQIKRERMIEIVNYINQLNTTWKAAVPNRDYSILLGHIKEKKNKMEDEVILKSPSRREKKVTLPENYDSREAHPECAEIIGEIPDQANCGSCWAVAPASTMSDRLCIKSEGHIKKFVSSMDILTCCEYGHGCKGGTNHYAFSYWIEHGVVTGGKYHDENSCKPYFLPECDHHMKEEIFGPCPNRTSTPECLRGCQDTYLTSYEDDKTYGKSVYSVWNDEEEIMREIFENGPVVTDFRVYEDFFVYDNGIYKHETGDYEGGHAVRILGWGVENGIKYWIVSNSWNKNWGIGGVFKILRGTNECDFEDGVIAGLPKF